MPSGLLASASRLYGADMNRLWGEVRAVPASRLEILNDRDSLEIVGHAVESAYTPGHASHHVSYFLPSARLAFVGDTAGIARQGGRLVIPRTPPPDIDLEAWEATIVETERREPARLALTHFGVFEDIPGHLARLRSTLHRWADRVAHGMDEEHARRSLTRLRRNHPSHQPRRSAGHADAGA
jgi:glyoxylase-like metal-dependent hydrolase (beta-lactamase superfamily II)